MVAPFSVCRMVMDVDYGCFFMIVVSFGYRTL